MARLPGVFVCRAVPVVLGAAFAGMGCAQLVGIDDTNNNNRLDTLTMTRTSVGATIESSALDLSGLTATYFVPRDGADGYDQVPAATTDPGLWTTGLHDPAPVEFTLPDLPKPVPQLFDFPNVRLAVAYSVLEHPAPSPAPDGAAFSVTVPLDAALTAADSFQTYVVGAWLRRPFAAAELPAAGATTIGPVNYAFTGANSVPGRPAPDLVTGKDVFLVLRYAGTMLTGVAEAAPLDQTAMTTSVTTAAMVPVSQDQMLAMTLAPTTLAARYMAVSPAVEMPAMTWSLVAAPGYHLASNAGPTLQSGSVAMTDNAVVASYGNPFVARDWRTIFTLATSESRVYTPAGATTPVTLFAAMNQFVDPSSEVPLNLPAGLPTSVTLDGAVLMTDGQAVAAPAGFATVTFATDTPPDATGPTATFYNLQIFDLVANQAGNALDRRMVLSAASRDARFRLPPGTLQAGHLYTLRAISTLGGYPKFAEGDFVERELPLAQSYLDSAAIMVTP